MKSIADRNLIRQYLLGRLDEQRELEEQLSDGILNNDEAMIDIVDSVEDEIIEEYLGGSRNAEHKEAVEKYFLRPPQRQEKLRSAQLLEHYFETMAPRYSATNRDLLRPYIPRFSRFRIYGAFAALALVTISTLLYINSDRHARQRLANELAKEREHSSNLATQAELVPPSIVPLTLVADRSRGPEAQIPQIDLDLDSSTQRVVVEIALQHAGSGPYDVRLESKAGENPMWSAKLLPIISSTGDARLVFDVPARTFQSDTYSFVVSSSSATGASTKHYDFQVKGPK